MSKFKGFVYGGPVPSSAGFYFGLGSGGGGTGVCSGASPGMLHFDFIGNNFYQRTPGQIGVTSKLFSDLISFTGPAARELTDAEGDTVTVGINQPRLGNYADLGSGLVNVGWRMNSADTEAASLVQGELARAIGIQGSELLTNGQFENWADPTVPDGWTNTGTHNATNFVEQNTDGIRIVSDGTFTGVTQNTGIAGSKIVGIEVVSISGQGVVVQFDQQSFEISQTGMHYFVTTDPSPILILKRWTGATDVVVRLVTANEVTMPSAVTFALSGYITYTDNNQPTEAILSDWGTGDDFVRVRLQTHIGTGAINVLQRTGGAASQQVTTAANALSPGTNEPFWFAHRSGTSFVNSAINGVLSTENTGPSAVPDVISQLLEIAPDANLNITSLTISAGDWGNDGIQDAVTDGSGFNPLCPYDG